MPIRTFEDFETGQVYHYGGRTLSKDEIVAFARVFDAQPMHVDEAAAAHTFVGRLIASGWHTIAIGMRMIVDGFLGDAGSLGAPGVDRVRWLKPVLPGDTLSARLTITGTKASASRPDLGFVFMSIDMLNQHGEVVMDQTHAMMFPRRAVVERTPPALSSVEPAPPDEWYGRNGSVQSGFSFKDVGPQESLPRFEALPVGFVMDLGSCHFSADDIVAYARCFDGQPFHLDEEAAKKSHFGGLIASGWQTADCWMTLMNENRVRRSRAMKARGEAPPQFGPSPGFEAMRWLKPVYAGETIAYSSTVIGKRRSASRPGWGITNQRNQGVNAKGELVFEFIGTVFWEV